MEQSTSKLSDEQMKKYFRAPSSTPVHWPASGSKSIHYRWSLIQYRRNTINNNFKANHKENNSSVLSKDSSFYRRQIFEKTKITFNVHMLSEDGLETPFQCPIKVFGLGIGDESVRTGKIPSSYSPQSQSTLNSELERQLNSSSHDVERFLTAISEFQFSPLLDKIKSMLPEALLTGK